MRLVIHDVIFIYYSRYGKSARIYATFMYTYLRRVMQCMETAVCFKDKIDLYS